ncbi:phosphatidylinositol 4-phosphate 3-kinase C2 domain-containing subunit beta-like isoform X1 [Biomphalaria glabrata]|uniref:Phosphatidylinositol 4-phosphate 3-kinase C2 domain-containing subunit beta-like isoform X1 n=1 Tax=Biomphalaria glabrata TaxID=6526 RepID=A0A9W3BJM0_BIOGL|nr:phosphatidylinositol 4-phosphate 3-kinase C2 domain-containing subunit beta-like isoform X1 [Biomphalaria glabrata]XP_055899739.1 phosphatidylinositol 4-phosphate 3-kinase C2 domain-containing subunit beta-like isoform X1 [Biomphalaria glabrata]
MASSRDSGTPPAGLIPPPVAAPRNRRSPVNILSEEASEPPKSPPVPAPRHSLKNRYSDEAFKSSVPKSNSMYSQDPAPFTEVSNRFSLPTTTNHPDLDGLDFSSSAFPALKEEQRPRSASMEELNQKPIYPDIRHAFVGLAEFQTNNLQFTYGNTSNHAHLSRPTSVPPSTNYGWNVPHYTSSSGGQLLNSSTNFNNMPSGFYNPYQPYGTAGNGVSVSSDASKVNVSQFNPLYPTTFAAYDQNPLNKPQYPVAGSTMNFNPNIGFNLPAQMSGTPSYPFGPQKDQNLPSPTVVAGSSEGQPFPDRATSLEERDLIDLGEVLPEHEYLSLDYFDPLYSRGRKESISSANDTYTPKESSRMTFSFGEAFLNLYKDHVGDSAAYDHKVDELATNDDHIWGPLGDAASQGRKLSIGFEAFNLDIFGQEKFVSSEGELTKRYSSAAYDSPVTSNESTKSVSKPDRPVSWKVPKDKRFEKLRKRKFIDPESESFCQMVTDLKKMYPSSEEKTNQGFLVNQIRECHMSSIQVKVVVHTMFATEPVIFTCDTDALVEHVISHVLYTLAPADPQPNTELFILKVYDRAEYLVNDLPLAKFDYTHSCLKLDRDICLELVTCEEVSRPFIRTKDDDIQVLYFPKEYINTEGAAVSEQDLSIYLDTFYHEINVMLEHFSQPGYDSFQLQGLQQSVKAICVSLAGVETVDVSKCLMNLRRQVSEMMSPSPKPQTMSEEIRQDKDTQEAIYVAMHCSLLEDLQAAVDALLDAVKTLVRMYCRTFLTDFFLGSSIEIPHDHTEIVKMKDFFIIDLSSAHRIPAAWKTKYESYKIVCSLYHGTKRLVDDMSTTLKPLASGLCEKITWDEWLNFERMPLCIMPRETRLCLMLLGVPSAPGTADKPGGVTRAGDAGEVSKLLKPLGAASLQLFNEKGYLNQGPQLVPLIMGASSDPIMPSCKTVLPDSVLLHVNLPDFDKTIYFPEPLNCAFSPKKSFDTLTEMVRLLVYGVMEKETCLGFTSDELEILWTHRHYMKDHPTLLPRILMAAHSWDWASLPEIYALLRDWKPLPPMQAFELLLPQYPDLKVRQFATDCLNKIPSDDLIDFLPQMIQGLKFESYHNSPLAKLLLEQSCKSPRFAHQFFWLLKGPAPQDRFFKRRYELMFAALANVSGDTLYQEFKKQEDLLKIVTSIAEKVKVSKEKDATLKRELVPLCEMLEHKGRILLPINPSVEVVGLDMKSCSYFTSNAFPLRLVFKNANPKADSHYIIYKVGDDLRQDMLTLQMIRIMDNLWLQKGLDLRMILFACLATGPKRGIIELITESETLRKIQVNYGLTGSFKDRPIKEWLQKHNPTELEYKRAVENFTRSCAGYCVATYVLGVCDRHNDNIMLKQSGHMFHIDFSKFLGDAQMFGSFKRDRVPFVLTSDMGYVINDGGKQGHNFQHFVDLCCQAFNILRNHADLFRSLFILVSCLGLFILMIRSGIPGVNERAVQYVQNALLPGQTDAQATATFTRMIEESMKSMFTQFNFFLHNLAQLKFSSHNEGTLLSFVTKVHSKDTDGRITNVVMHSYQKRYTPDKHYIFILLIERENQKVPMYIFRHFSEFVEFRDKLNEMFPLVTWPNFSTRLVIGRSNIRPVAESRKTEIVSFIKYLRSLSAEISECDLVYTFFHPMLRDEQEAEKNKQVTKLREPNVQHLNNAGNTGIKGEIKLSIQYKRDALQVMVMHVRGLSEASELPSPYAKTYLLPDPEKQTKLKTKVVKNTTCPTFNELLQYQLTEREIRTKILQVTVWDSAVLKENNFLGAVYVRLRDLDLVKDNTFWHKLGRIQMPNFT